MAHCFVPNVSSDVNARSRVFVFINEGSFQSMNGRVKCQFNDNSQLPIYRKDNYFKTEYQEQRLVFVPKHTMRDSAAVLLRLAQMG